MKYITFFLILISINCKAQFYVHNNGFLNPATNESVEISIDYYKFKTKQGYKPNQIWFYNKGIVIDKVTIDSFNRTIVLSNGKTEYHSYYYGINQKKQFITIEGFSQIIDEDFDHLYWLKYIVHNEEKLFVKN